MPISPLFSLDWSKSGGAPIKQIAGLRPFDQSQPASSTIWIAWWHCGMHKPFNPSNPSVVSVAFKELYEDFSYSDKYRYANLSIGALSTVKIGSLWKEGRRIGESTLNRIKATVSFTKGDWEITSLEECYLRGRTPPFLEHEYPTFPKGPNKVIIFSINGSKLIIPCWLFFDAWFGKSDKTKEILTNFSWEQAERLLYNPFFPKTEINRWHIHLRKEIPNSDGIFLSHLRHDNYAKMIATSIRSNILNTFKKSPNLLIGIFPEIEPWFQGMAKMIIDGIPVNHGRDFLALRIIGRSNPDGPEVVISRDNENPDEGGSRDNNEEWSGASRNVHLPHTNIEYNLDEVPGRSTSTVHNESDGILIIGKPRKVTIIKSENAIGSRSSGSHTPGQNTFSNSEASGKGDQVGKVRFQIGDDIDASAPHWDTWKSLLYLQSKYQNRIESINWYTPKSGFSQSNPVTLNSFLLHGKMETSKWTILNIPPIGPRPRGFLLARAEVDGRTIFFIEIERKHSIHNRNGIENITYDNYCGMIFELQDPDQITRITDTVKLHGAAHRGTLKSLQFQPIGEYQFFQHDLKNKSPIPGVRTVVSAFTKIGIAFPYDSQ